MTVNTSDLDFVNIKSKLKTYFKNSSEFKDYDFDASGLSSILDVLAYNTHVNALIANMAINESFLSTSQLRSSVLGHAESLGYTPRSKSSATATVDIVVSDPLGSSSEELIPARTRFTASVDDAAFVFYTNQEYVASRNSDDEFVFSGVDVYEGKERTKTFFADADIETVFVIPDSDIDTTTMIVDVYENSTSNVSIRYKNILTAPAITNDSRVYMLRETPAGEYEMYFGDGELLGIRPSAGNVIQVSYIATSGADANGAAKFAVDAFDGYDKSVVTVSPASGGSEKESVEEIKVNAPRAFATQQRLVTAEDYTSTIKSLYGQYLKDVTSWGGNDNVPPKFGSVFVSINFLDGYTDSVKNEIKKLIKENLTDYRSIMSIDTEFVDPEVVKLKLVTSFNLDATLATTSSESYRQQIRDLISRHFRENMSTFNSTFRRSNLLAKVDDYSPAILNSKMSVMAQREIDVNALFEEVDQYNAINLTESPEVIERDVSVNFPFLMATPDNDDYVVSTSAFKYFNKTALVRNKLGSYTLQIVDAVGNVLVANIGDYNPAQGTVNFKGFPFDRSSGSIVKVNVMPANQSTIKPLRNYLFELDSDSIVLVNVEADGTKVLL